MNPSKILAIVYLTLTGMGVVNAQEKRVNIGIGYKIGFSQNLKYAISAPDNWAINTSVPTYSNSIFALVRLRKDTLEYPLRNLRISILGSNKSGVFNIDNVLNKVGLGIVELEALLPLNIKISDNLYYYIGFGANAGFVVNQNKGTPSSNVFYPGAVIEIGLSTFRGLYFGVQITNSFGDYPMQAITTNFGITPAEVRKGIKRMRSR